MRIAISLLALLAPQSVRAEPPSATEFDTRIAKLVPSATDAERLAAVKWVRANDNSPHAPRAIPALERLVSKDPDVEVRRTAVAALVKIVHRHDVSCPLGLIVALRDPVDEVRWEASVLSGPYKRRLAPGVLEALIAATTDERTAVRSICLIHLAEAAGRDVKARAAIEKAKDDKVFEVRHTAHSAGFIATGDVLPLLTYIIRVREDPPAVLDRLAEGSEAAKLQAVERNGFILGSTTRILDWTETRPDDLATALMKLLEDKSPAIRRGAVDITGLAARKTVFERLDPPGGINAILPLLDRDWTAPAEPPPALRASKTYASLLSRGADDRLRELSAKDPDESVRAAAKRALERFREVPVPLDIPPREIKR